MIGFLYRVAVGLKEFGERHNMSRLIRLGLWLRDQLMWFPVSNLF
jgi:hypothetical protein